MLRINQMIFTLQQIANSDTLLLTDFFPVKEFVDGKSTDKIVAYRYVCVCPMNKYEQIAIRIEQTEAILTPEELSSKGSIKVKPKGFEGRFYRDRSGEYQFTAKATTLEVLG
ncbi:hypothetical protein [Clostridium merdae]|uniref:hypothetical protein n=1 Tax=Clostridium merdae TaxID=1958780 RepID=UPI000A26E744|nr:hypothetical protein [Clostridium merdae]